VANFIPFESTLQAARKAGLSAGQYIDTVMNKTPDATRETIRRLAAMGVYSADTRHVVEIGPGSGRYLEHTLKHCAPEKYEAYETAPQWAAYLRETFPIIVQPPDGHTLNATATAATDVAHAHKVFSTIPFSKTIRYWREMVRVTAPGGYIAFDAFTETCLDSAALETWTNAAIENGSFPAALPRSTVISYFENRGFSFLGSFNIPVPPGETEVFAFRKDKFVEQNS
jgi:phospholipid N-methyltransferase